MLPLRERVSSPSGGSSFLPSLFGRRRPDPHSPSPSASGRSRATATCPAPPPARDWQFSEIMAALARADGAATRRDIDAIAEICGRSRLSLADAHDDHRMPYGAVAGEAQEHAAGQEVGYGYVGSGYGAAAAAAFQPALARSLETVAEVRTPAASLRAADQRWPGSYVRDDGAHTARAVVRRSSGVAIGRGAEEREGSAEGRARRQLLKVSGGG